MGKQYKEIRVNKGDGSNGTITGGNFLDTVKYQTMYRYIEALEEMKDNVGMRNKIEGHIELITEITKWYNSLITSEYQMNELNNLYDIYLIERNNGHVPCVYWVYSNSMQAVKIGYTTDAMVRKSSIISNCKSLGQDAELLGVYTTYDSSPYELEKYFHELYSEYRTHGEWFDISRDEVMSIITKGSYITDNGIAIKDFWIVPPPFPDRGEYYKANKSLEHYFEFHDYYIKYLTATTELQKEQAFFLDIWFKSLYPSCEHSPAIDEMLRFLDWKYTKGNMFANVDAHKYWEETMNRLFDKVLNPINAQRVERMIDREMI